MSEHRFRRHLVARPARRTLSHAPSATAATAPAPAFVPAPVAAAPQAFMAEVYRLAYAAALARIVARRRCFAPFSLN